MPATPNNDYHAYLLRFWRDDVHSPWRIVLIDSQTGAKYGFPSIEVLYSFLDGQLVGDASLPYLELTDEQN